MKFLPVAAAQSGKILNFSSIGREAGIDPKSVERYYEILEDTLLGFRLPAYHRSVRKQQAFEELVILECFRLNDYLETDYRFSYLLTKDGAEIDLIVEKGNQAFALIEVKSKTEVFSEDLRHLRGLADQFKKAKKWVFARADRRKQVGDITVFPWVEGLKELFPGL